MQSFRQYNDKIMEQHGPGSSFTGLILPISVIYLFLAVGFVFFISYAIVSFKLLQPHMHPLQQLFRAKGALLMIMISAPLIAVLFLVMCYLYQIILRKQMIQVEWSAEQFAASVGNKNYVFKKNEVKRSVFFVNRLNHLTKWLLITKKGGKRYFLLSQDYKNSDYQGFINSYVKYFDIDIEKCKDKIGSTRSILIQRKYDHS